jgi:hypothetical protein
MNFIKYTSLFFLLFSFSILCAQTEIPKKPALPSAQQVQWQNIELTMFMHFGPTPGKGETEVENV